MPKPDQAHIIYEKTMEEINKGFLQPLMDETELNARFGPGAWAFLMRSPWIRRARYALLTTAPRATMKHLVQPKQYTLRHRPQLHAQFGVFGNMHKRN